MHSQAQDTITGQFGKNHLGDKGEHLASNHGFGVFLGNRCKLNAEEEPENADFPKGPHFTNAWVPVASSVPELTDEASYGQLMARYGVRRTAPEILAAQ